MDNGREGGGVSANVDKTDKYLIISKKKKSFWGCFFLTKESLILSALKQKILVWN